MRHEATDMWALWGGWRRCHETKLAAGNGCGSRKPSRGSEARMIPSSRKITAWNAPVGLFGSHGRLSSRGGST